MKKLILVLKAFGFCLIIFTSFGDLILDTIYPSDIDPKIKNAQSLLPVIIKYALFVLTFIMLIFPTAYFFLEANRDLIKTIKISWRHIVASLLCFFGYYFIDFWMDSPPTRYFITAAILLL